MQSVLFSVRSKGLLKYLKRGQAIAKSYGMTPAKMAQALDQFSQILGEFECEATFPITAIAAKRNSKIVTEHIARGIEFAIHGYRHIDHAQLALEEQLSHLRHAQDVFASAGIPVTGFRAPYLRFNQASDRAARVAGLEYVSNQPILWDALQDELLPPAAQAAYERAIVLYNPWRASERFSLPQLCDQLVQIPVSLPDDEMLLDRLDGDVNGLVEQAWSHMLSETYRRQELLTLQLHPERIARCAPALRALLAKARSLYPPVWITRLDKLASWWRARSQATITVDSACRGELCLNLAGPEGLTMLIRSVDVQGPVHPWLNGYQCSEARHLVVKTPLRPFIGVPTNTPPEWVGFLREQGYLVEISDQSRDYSIYLNRPDPLPENRHAILAQIEKSDKPLVKLGRWPHNTCSALSITGDIDALTLWDYGLRFLGR